MGDKANNKASLPPFLWELTKPAIHAPPEGALTANCGREAGTRTAQTLGTSLAKAAFYAPAAVAIAHDGHDEEGGKHARPAAAFFEGLVLPETLPHFVRDPG